MLDEGGELVEALFWKLLDMNNLDTIDGVFGGWALSKKNNDPLHIPNINSAIK